MKSFCFKYNTKYTLTMLVIYFCFCSSGTPSHNLDTDMNAKPDEIEQKLANKSSIKEVYLYLKEHKKVSDLALPSQIQNTIKKKFLIDNILLFEDIQQLINNYFKKLFQSDSYDHDFSFIIKLYKEYIFMKFYNIYKNIWFNQKYEVDNNKKPVGVINTDFQETIKTQILQMFKDFYIFYYLKYDVYIKRGVNNIDEINFTDLYNLLKQNICIESPFSLRNPDYKNIDFIDIKFRNNDKRFLFVKINIEYMFNLNIDNSLPEQDYEVWEQKLQLIIKKVEIISREILEIMNENTCHDDKVVIFLFPSLHQFIKCGFSKIYEYWQKDNLEHLFNSYISIDGASGIHYSTFEITVLYSYFKDVISTYEECLVKLGNNNLKILK